MNATRTDARRQIDFSAVRNPDRAFMHALAGLLSRRREPMTKTAIAKWFRATPPEFIAIQLDFMAVSGQVKTIIPGSRGVAKYGPEVK